MELFGWEWMKEWTGEVVKWLQSREKEAEIFLGQFESVKRIISQCAWNSSECDDTYLLCYYVSNKYVWRNKITNNS